MSAKFYNNGSIIRVFDERDVSLYDTLANQIYEVKVSPKGELYLEQKDYFEDNTPIYGELKDHPNRVINTFSTREKSTGVLFSGKQGSGKTKVTRGIIAEWLNRGFGPVLKINKGVNLIVFGEFLNRINQTCLVIIDEFEKLYKQYEDSSDDNRNDQSNILALLDGHLSPNNKCLFLLIVNNLLYLNQYLLNRPGRLYYHFRYNTISEQILEEYCNDHLQNKDLLPDFRNLLHISNNITFDVITSIVEECNRYNCTPLEAVNYLNVVPYNNERDDYLAVITDEETGIEYSICAYLDLSLLTKAIGVTLRGINDEAIVKKGTTNEKIRHPQELNININDLIKVLPDGHMLFKKGQYNIDIDSNVLNYNTFDALNKRKKLI